jgi:hypothetical protein
MRCVRSERQNPFPQVRTRRMPRAARMSPVPPGQRCASGDRPARPARQATAPAPPLRGLDRPAVHGYVLGCGCRTSRRPLACPARVLTSSRELPRRAHARPPAGVCLAGLVVSPARCSQADAARAASPPCAARAAGRPPRPVPPGRLPQDLAPDRSAGGAERLEPFAPCLPRWWPRAEDLWMHRSQALLVAT